jgi:hypothetical protein
MFTAKTTNRYEKRVLRSYAKSCYALRKYLESGAATTLRQFVGRRK